MLARVTQVTLSLIAWTGNFCMLFSVLLAYWYAYPFLEGCDAPYYAIASRDLANGVPGSETARQYFPGVYWFWQVVAPWLWPNPPQIVNIAEALLCLLCSLSALLVCRSLKLSALYQMCAFWATSASLINFEGFSEVSEQLILLFFFLSLTVFLSMPRQRGATYELLVGLLLALCLSVKQQSILVVAPFFLGVFAYSLASSKSLIKSFVAVTLVGARAAFFFLMFLFMSGYRVSDFFGGATYATGYGSMCSGLSCLMSALSSYLWLFILPCCYVIKALMRRQVKAEATAVLISTGAAFMSCFQFMFRPYGHYGMLVVAPLVVANCITLHVLSAPLRSSRAIISLIAWSLTYAVLIPAASQWTPRKIPTAAAPWVVPGYTNSPRSVYGLCEFLPKNEPVLVLPLMFYQTHLMCGTTPATAGLGYPTFVGGPKVEEIVRSRRYRTIAIFEHFKTPNEVWSSADGCHDGGGCGAIIEEISELGYRLVAISHETHARVYRLQESAQDASQSQPLPISFD